MKRFAQSMLGVTLLEIMLVLAIAAMIIVMSVRYYQSASASQQANDILQKITAITAVADGIAQGTGRYTGVTSAAVKPMMPNQSMATPWGGGDITITGEAAKYNVTIPGMPANVCSQISPKLQANDRFVIDASTSCSGGDFKYSYGY